MEFRTYNAENYLKKNKPEEPAIELIESIKKSAEPRVDIDYKNSSFAKIEKGSDTLELSFTELNNDSRDALSEVLNSVGGSREYIQERLDTSKWKELTSFNISRNAHNEPVLDLIKLLPQDCKIFFFPQKKFINACAITSDDKAPLILYLGDLSAEIFAPIMLHEIGHIIDHDNLKIAKKDSFIVGPGHEMEAEKLRSERAATAYALQILRSRFRENSILEKTVALNFLKSFALNTYHNSIDSILKQKEADWHNFGRRMWNEYEDEKRYAEEQEIYDKQVEEFEKTKITDQYREWKVRHPEIDEWSEMHEWHNWQEFLEWKKTPEYAQWKSIPENSIVNDSEDEYAKTLKDKKDEERIQWEQQVQDEKYFEEWSKTEECNEWLSTSESEEILKKLEEECPYDHPLMLYWYKNIKEIINTK